MLFKVSGNLHSTLGPMLVAGKELASSASEALGIEMTFENVSR